MTEINNQQTSIENDNSFNPSKLSKVNIIESIINRLKLWTLLILPSFGFLIGHLIQYLFNTKENSKYASILVMLVMMIFMILVLNDVIMNENPNFNPKDRLLLTCICYLFVLGVVFGIVSFG